MASAKVWKSILPSETMFGHFGAGLVQMLAEHLEDWDAARHELEHVVALEFASGGDGTEDHADVGEASAADLRGVGHGLEDLGELVAFLDAGC